MSGGLTDTVDRGASISLSIGGLPICGSVGSGARVTVPVGDCWIAYCRWVESFVAEGRPVCVLDAVWAVDDHLIDTPRAWFVTLECGHG